ncbi:hypothetical protein [Actinoplanes sp. NPDC020271]|uniref:hypothetical protein n=1 Tax=Actinoplanes sp. NPDC020271 TaxID=3363896 RepID=UPI0037BE095C
MKSAARLLSGAAVGMLTATATACLMELHTRARPGAGRRAGLLRAGRSTGSPSGG